MKDNLEHQIPRFSCPVLITSTYAATSARSRSCNGGFLVSKNLLLDDITIASQCAKTIFGVHGFNAWVAWVNKCKGRTLPNLHSSLEFI
ncbi:hypothetical protein SFRURICE_020304 [Spodoptera frugiperda]|nr:hypothetical protein SFRURICE_020304 [Spodoptera frugiperda]